MARTFLRHLHETNYFFEAVKAFVSAGKVRFGGTDLVKSALFAGALRAG